MTVLPVIALLAAQAARQQESRRAVFLLVLLLANFAAIYATANRQIYVALAVQAFVGAAFFARRIREPRFLIAAVVLVLGLGTLFHLKTSSRIGSTTFVQSVDIGAALNADGRLPVWKFAIEESLKHPLTGAGMGRNAFSRRYADHPLAQPPLIIRITCWSIGWCSSGSPAWRFFSRCSSVWRGCCSRRAAVHRTAAGSVSPASRSAPVSLQRT